MQVFTLHLHASLVSRGKHSLHCIIEYKYGQGFT